MKKKLLLVISLALIVLLSSCDTSDMVFLNHDYHLSYNTTMHFELCDCGEIINEEAHEYKTPFITKEATCEETGIQKEVCKTCGYVKETSIPKLNHNFNDWEVYVEATCISNGQLKRSCINCGYEEYKDTNKIAHTKTSYTDIDANCQHEGHVGGSYCSFCNQEIEAYTIVDKTGHSYGELVTIEEATCTGVGSAERKCTICGNTEHKVLDKIPHVETSFEEDESTCNYKGHTGGSYCSLCNTILEERTELDYANHTYGDWVTTKEPTCTSIGTSERKCTICGNTEHKVLDKLPHVETLFEEDESTCNYKGHTGGSYCSICNTILEERTELEYADHTYGDWVTTKEPTCTSIGTSERVCSICGNTEHNVLEKLPHKEESYIEDESTCIYKGHTGGKYCSVCNTILEEREELDFASHNYSDWETTKEPTCTSIGSSERKCTVCGNTEHKDLDMIPHTIADYEYDPSTCIYEGHTGGTYCTVCNQVIEERTKLELSNHTYGDWITTDNPTCTQIGHAKRVCEICGNTEYKDLEMLPHTITSYDDLEANCQHEGHIGGTYCSVCNTELTPYTVVDKTDHSFGAWVTSIDATCISKGQEKRICSVCLKEEYRDTNMTSHISTPYQDLVATCEHEGHVGGTYCSFCNVELTPYTVTSKAAHTYGDFEETQVPTCISKGQAKRVCIVCGNEDFTELNIIEHTSTPYTDLEANCIHEGHVGGTYCSFCNKELTPYTVTSTTPHTYGEWEETQAPTCISKGQAKCVCTVCGIEDYKELDMISHTSTPYAELEANCIHEGHTGGTYCSFCNKELTPYTVVGKTAHTYSDWTQSKAPTCITVGQEVRECTLCHNEEYRDVAKTAHTPIKGTPKASTCIEHGHTEGLYCSFCSALLEAPQELPYSDHNYSIETITKNATLNSEGILTHTCSVCGDSYTTPIEKLELTQMIWINSLRRPKCENKYLEVYYEEAATNKQYDLTIMSKDGIQYFKIYDYHTSKIYEYYYDGNQVVESCVGGYRHKAYDDFVDPFIRYLELRVLNSVYFSSFSYDKVEWKNEPENYFIAQNIEMKDCKGNTEIATVAIQIDDDLNLTMYAYTSEKYMINIQEIGASPNITIPTATHHHIVDGKCDICNEAYDTYTTSKNNLNLNYYVNKNNKSLEFDYELVYSNQYDVTFLSPTYYENGNIKRFTSLYFEGNNNYYSKQVKSVEYKSSNHLLKITYKDYSIERLILLNDGTCISVKSDSATASNYYNGSPYGHYFDLVTNDKTVRYYLKSETEVQVTQYKEINYYIYNDKTFIDFNGRNLDSIFNHLYSSYSDGIKHDGSTGYIYFKLNSDLSLDIYYEGISNSMKPFSAVTFKNISGNSSDFTISFMADNENYELHYNGNITVTKK